MATSKTKFIAYQKSIKIWKKYNKVHLDHKLTKIWEEAFRAGWNANKKHYNDKMKIYNSIDNVKIYNSIENIIKRNIMKNKSRKVNKLKKLGIK